MTRAITIDWESVAILGLLQRILLVSDGTLKDLLEAAFLEPISLMKLRCEVLTAPATLDDLEVLQGEAIMEREILLFGEGSGKVYVHANSVLALQRLPAQFIQSLLASSKPLGRFWIEQKLETRKELLGISRCSATERSRHFQEAEGRELLSRKYRLISGSRPTMVIAECFQLILTLWFVRPPLDLELIGGWGLRVLPELWFGSIVKNPHPIWSVAANPSKSGSTYGS